MSLDLVNCRKCGKLFHQVSSKRICPDCQKELEDKYQEVRGYIKEHPGSSIMEVSNEMDVSVEQIRQWVREERLEFDDPSASGIFCESCGVAISTGKFCEKCRKNMTERLGNAYNKPAAEKKEQVKTSAKMRFLDGN